jgi:hypothetical protein
MKFGIGPGVVGDPGDPPGGREVRELLQELIGGQRFGCHNGVEVLEAFYRVMKICKRLHAPGAIQHLRIVQGDRLQGGAAATALRDGTCPRLGIVPLG